MKCKPCTKIAHDIIVIMFYFYFIKFVYSLLSTTSESNRIGDWEGDSWW